MNVISKEDFLLWRNHPITDRLLEAAQANIEDLANKWLSGGYMYPSAEETALQNAKHQGIVLGIASFKEAVASGSFASIASEKEDK